MVREDSLMPRHGGYRKLKSFQIAQLSFDVTVRFCERHVDRFSRTRDQMVQAARSGVQNIAEGSKASGTSKKTELKLTNVARASLEELRLDYEDFLRQRNLPVWERADQRRGDLINARCTNADEVDDWVDRLIAGKNGFRPGGEGKSASVRSQPDSRSRLGDGGVDEVSLKQIRPTRSTISRASTPSIQSTESMMSTKSTSSTPSTKSTVDSAEAEILANAALALIAVACGLLDRQLARLSRDFEEKGGFTERLYQRRIEKRNRSRKGP